MDFPFTREVSDPQTLVYAQTTETAANKCIFPGHNQIPSFQISKLASLERYTLVVSEKNG